MAVVARKSLYEAFGDVPDPRSTLGTQHPLPALLTLATVGLLSGCRGLSGISQWGRDHAALMPLLGFTRRVKQKKEWKKAPKLKLPCTSTFHYLFKAIDIEAFEKVLTDWLLEQDCTDGQPRVLNIDGKALRGSHQGAVPGVHLVAAFASKMGTALAQLQVDAKTNEHKAALQLLHLIPLEDTLVTGDAAFTQKDLCQEIVNRKGDYFFTVKDNQPTLKKNILDAFAAPVSPSGESETASRGPKR
jgi:predicted transposase YbfD/YdcC